jgi:hypothetical protein
MFGVLQVTEDRSIPFALYNKLRCGRGTILIAHLDKRRSSPSSTEIFNVHSFETIRQFQRCMPALHHRNRELHPHSYRAPRNLSIELFVKDDFLLGCCAV